MLWKSETGECILLSGSTFEAKAVPNNFEYEKKTSRTVSFAITTVSEEGDFVNPRPDSHQFLSCPDSFLDSQFNIRTIE